jgi:hypothetical protein
VGLAAVAVALNALLGIAAWVLVPTNWMAALFVISFPPLLWAFLESAANGPSEAARDIVRMHRLLTAVIALTLAADVGTDLAIHTGLLAAGAELVEERFSWLMKGALFALWGNRLPKLMSPWPLEREPFDWQAVHRFVGRVAVVAGLGLLVAWSMLPVDAAERAAEIIVASACVLGVGYKLLSVLRYAGRERSALQP